MLNYGLINAAVVLAIVCMLPLVITAIYSVAEFIVVVMEVIVDMVCDIFHINSDKDD